MRSDWFFLVLVTFCLTDNSQQSVDKDQQESRAVAEKPYDDVVKFDTYRNCSAASRGPPCDSMASCSSLAR